MRRPLVAIESLYKGDVVRNKEFARAICRYAVDHGQNPYAMHLFFTQFLDDNAQSERDIGIECGLGWTDLAEEVWFCLRPGEIMTAGMRLAYDHHHQLLEQHRHRALRMLRFTQDGQLLAEEGANSSGRVM